MTNDDVFDGLIINDATLLLYLDDSKLRLKVASVGKRCTKQLCCASGPDIFSI